MKILTLVVIYFLVFIPNRVLSRQYSDEDQSGEDEMIADLDDVTKVIGSTISKILNDEGKIKHGASKIAPHEIVSFDMSVYRRLKIF
jgi:hypothetical protein